MRFQVSYNDDDDAVVYRLEVTEIDSTDQLGINCEPTVIEVYIVANQVLIKYTIFLPREDATLMSEQKVQIKQLSELIWFILFTINNSHRDLKVYNLNLLTLSFVILCTAVYQCIKHVIYLLFYSISYSLRKLLKYISMAIVVNTLYVVNKLNNFRRKFSDRIIQWIHICFCIFYTNPLLKPIILMFKMQQHLSIVSSFQHSFLLL